MGDRLEDVLFSDPVQRAAFLALVDSDDLGEAIDGASGPVQSLLVRLTVEEPRSEPDEVVAQLVRDAVRRELPVLTVEARTSSGAMEEAAQVAAWLQDLDRKDSSAEASRPVGSVATREVSAERIRGGRMTAKKVVPLYPGTLAEERCRVAAGRRSTVGTAAARAGPAPAWPARGVAPAGSDGGATWRS